MKAKLLSIAMLVILLSAGSVKTSGQQLSLGAKAGVGLSNFSNYESNGMDVKRLPNVMVQGGFVLDYGFTKLFGIKAEILFQQKGEVYKDAHSSAKFKIYFNYITLPILFRVSHSFGNFTLSGGAGPYVGYALNGKLVGIEPDNNSSKLEFGKDKSRRFDAGLCIDMGGGFKLGPGTLFLDLRYDLGLMDISQPASKPSGYKTHDTRNFGICAGYLIPLGR
jgi:hypothetical protein